MKSILVLVEQFTMGGLETHIRGEIERLHAQGCQVHLAVGRNFDTALLPVNIASVTRDLPWSSDCTVSDLMSAVESIRGLVQRWRIDAIHAHPFVSLVPGMIAAQAEKIPLAITLHGPASLAGYAGPLYDFLVKALVLPSTSLLVSVSPEVQEMAMYYVPENASLCLPNAVSFNHNAIEMGAVDPCWLVVSRLDDAKVQGIRDFIAKAMEAGLPGVVIAGDGGAREDLEQWVVDKGWAVAVRFLGAQTEVIQCMTRYAGVAGMGRVILEAISVQKPVVLLGYDGTKGVVDSALLERARWANFSGRNLPTVSASGLAMQLQALDSLTQNALYKQAVTGFDEDVIWQQFYAELAQAQAAESNVLHALYRSLQTFPLDEQIPFYHSAAVMQRVEGVCCSPRYFDARVQASWQACVRLTTSQHTVELSQISSQLQAQAHIIEAHKLQILEQQQTLQTQQQAYEVKSLEVVTVEQLLAQSLLRVTNLEQQLESAKAHTNELAQSRTIELAACTATADQLRDQANAAESELDAMRIQLGVAQKAIVAGAVQLQSIKKTLSWKITRPARVARQVAQAFINPAARYSLVKAVYWHLPSGLRHRLNGQRSRYVAAHWSDKQAAEQISVGAQSPATQGDVWSEWLHVVNTATKVAVIPCGFEFDELVNQRPINAAKYFAQRGYVVIFVAWQWSRGEALSKGCMRVWPQIYQVPLYEFLDRCMQLPSKVHDALYLLTMPAAVLVQCVPTLRSKSYSIVYDVMDEWEEFHRSGQAPWFVKSVEEQLILQSDLVCGVAPALVDKFAHIRRDILRIGNGYSVQVMGAANRAIAAIETGRIVGYFGHLTDAWFDWKLVFALAAAHPELQFEMIGYGEPDWVRKESLRYTNVHLRGKVHPSQLNAYVRNWRAALIPFVEGRLSQAVDPIKIYEYLYFGLPVFATGIEHLQNYPNTVWAERSSAVTAFAEWLAQTPKEGWGLEAFLEETTWDARFDTLVSELHKHKSLGELYVL